MTNPISPLGLTTSNIGSSANKTQSNSRSADSNQDTTSTNHTASSDTVSLSQQSQQVAGLQQELKNTPEVDSLKVESIKQEIANGNYPLDPDKIAENLISLERSLLE